MSAISSGNSHDKLTLFPLTSAVNALADGGTVRSTLTKMIGKLLLSSIFPF